MLKNNIDIRKATTKEELEKLHEIRQTVFVVEQNCPPELEWEHEEESIHFIAFVHGEPAGTARWRKTENGIKLERFAVLKEFRGMGIGKALVRNVLADIMPSKDDHVYLNAQVTAIKLYETCGFEKVGDQFEEAGIQHFKMVLKK